MTTAAATGGRARAPASATTAPPTVAPAAIPRLSTATPTAPAVVSRPGGATRSSRVMKTVSSMIRFGLPTKLIIPLLQQRCGARDVDGPDEDVVALLDAEAARLDSRIACMSLSRRAIQEYLDRFAPVSSGTRPSAASRS